MTEEEEAVAKWSLKDALIVIPFLASALALTWEVGYFARIRGGAFGLFSIAEHLTFALQALPIAMAVSTMTVMGLASASIIIIASRSLPAHRLQSVRYRSGIILALVVGSTLSINLFIAGMFDLVGVALIAVSVVPYAFIAFATRRLLMNPVILYVAVLGGFFVALGMGIINARQQIRSSLPLNSIRIGEEGKDTETEMKVRMLRTGERGILYFDPVAQTFGLLPWNHVKRVDWAISPLLHPR
jgi:hypothetical protein